MTFEDLIEHFGSQAEAARAIGVTRGRVWQWRLEGIPTLRQFQIERITGGALVASSDLMASSDAAA